MLKKLSTKMLLITMMLLLSACGNTSDNNSSSENEEKDDTSETGYAQVYMDKVLELDVDGKVDGYALIDVNGDDIPELAAASSEGELSEEGNAFLYTVCDGELVELLSVSEGFDGNHIYVSEGNNVILKTGSMSGNETYDLYSINGREVEETDNLMVLADLESDSYTYYEGETEIDEEKYIEDFDSAISAYNPFIGIDHDVMNEMNITIKDGTIDFEEISSDNYLSFNEIKEKLTELGADPAAM